MTLIPPTTLDHARSLFPYLASGHVYLNHAATSPLATPVVEALAAHIHDRAQGEIDTYGNDLPMVKAWRKNVCRLINAEGPERIAFAMNTSDALNTVAAGLPWRDGDHILLNNAEFPANLHPFLHLRRHGVEVDVMQVENGIVTPEAVKSRLRDETRLVAISAVQFLSGYRADLEAIGSLCRDRGIIFIVDGIQAVGAVPVDVQAMHIDCLAAGAQKWQMAPQGTGFLYVSEPLQSSITQQHVGWLSVASPWHFKDLNQDLDPTARRYEGGTLNIAGLHAMNAALKMLLDVGIDAIAGHILAITDILIHDLTSIAGVTCITPSDPAQRAGIVTVRPPSGVRAEEVAVLMRNAGVTIAVREGLLRFSPHFYNTPDEMHRAVTAMQDALRTAPRTPAAQEGPPMKLGGRILVIDDNPDARELLKDILTDKGFQILEAGDGEQALEVMSKSLVHMAIVDLDMPRMNGIEFSKRAKAARPDLPIIMVTAYSQFYVPADILASGIDAFLQKPLDLSRLLKAIEQL